MSVATLESANTDTKATATVAIAGANQTKVPLDGPTTALAAILTAAAILGLGQRVNLDRHALVVDGHDAGPTDLIEPGSEVALTPLVSNG